MKKTLFKWVAQLFAKLSKWDILGFESIVRHLYQNIIQHEFVVKNHEFVHVKKGKIKYTLLIVETSMGCVKFNLGRHDSNELEDQYLVTN